MLEFASPPTTSSLCEDGRKVVGVGPVETPGAGTFFLTDILRPSLFPLALFAGSFVVEEFLSEKRLLLFGSSLCEAGVGCC